jgi:hypothetical protein
MGYRRTELFDLPRHDLVSLERAERKGPTIICRCRPLPHIQRRARIQRRIAAVRLGARQRRRPRPPMECSSGRHSPLRSQCTCRSDTTRTPATAGKPTLKRFYPPHASELVPAVSLRRPVLQPPPVQPKPHDRRTPSLPQAPRVGACYLSVASGVNGESTPLDLPNLSLEQSNVFIASLVIAFCLRKP